MVDNFHKSKLECYMTKDKLRKFAIFILNYVEKND